MPEPPKRSPLVEAARYTQIGLMMVAPMALLGGIGYALDRRFATGYRDAVNRHQRGDKGFGPALGPAATATATALLGARGYRVLQGRSDWLLGPGEASLMAALIDGWAGAAAGLCRSDAAAIAAWRRHRLAAVAGGKLRVRVGHTDLLALPPCRGRPHAPASLRPCRL